MNLRGRLPGELGQPGERKSILPSDFQLPELHMPEKGEFSRKGVVEFYFDYEGTKYKGVLTIERFTETNPETTTNYPAEIIFEVYDGENKLTKFKGTLWHGRSDFSEKKDGIRHKFWHIGFRKVESSERRKGWGTIAISTLEDAIKKIGERYPDLRAEWVQMTTGLASLTRLLIDQEWLKQHNLGRFVGEGKNMGYLPFREDESRVALILEKGSNSLEDLLANPNKMPDINLYKDIK